MCGQVWTCSVHVGVAYVCVCVCVWGGGGVGALCMFVIEVCV